MIVHYVLDFVILLTMEIILDIAPRIRHMLPKLIQIHLILESPALRCDTHLYTNQSHTVAFSELHSRIETGRAEIGGWVLGERAVSPLATSGVCGGVPAEIEFLAF